MRAIARRLVHLVPVLFLVTLATFLMLELVPGDPAIAVLGPDASPEQYEAVREELGLNRPIVDRYVDWLNDALHGDLGRSLTPPVQDVTDMIRSRLPVTLQVTLMAIAMALLAAVPAALLCAHRPGGPFDRAVSGVAFGTLSVPSFLVGLLLVFFVVFRPEMVRAVIGVGAVALVAWMLYRLVVTTREHEESERARHVLVRGVGVVAVAAVFGAIVAFFPDFPRQGFVRITSDEGLRENLRSSFLPALTLASIEFGVFMRVLRSDLIATLQEDYILAARAKGTPTWLILVRDALRPSSFSLITVAGVALGRLVGGSVIVETIFNLPGVGGMLVEAIGVRNFPVVQGAVLVVALVYVLVNTSIDVAYSYLDPRIRRGRA